MAQTERPIKDYRPKINSEINPDQTGSGLRARDYRVEKTPILWHGENNKLISQAFMALQSGLVAVSLIAGMDKFVDLLTNWSAYVAPQLPRLLGFSSQAVSYGAGVIEILIAMGIAIWPRVFSNILVGWMGIIILNLLLTGQYFDLILQDFGLAAAAYAFSRLCQIKEEVPVVVSEPSEFSAPELAH